MKQIKITSKDGVTLHTANKYVDEDLSITLDESLLGSNGTPIELATSEEMQAVLVVENIGKIYKFVGETNETFTNGNLYQVMEVE